MRNGRRLTAVGMLTGGLLLVGFAAPSLADVGTADGADTTVSVVTTDSGQAGTSSDAPAKNEATKDQAKADAKAEQQANDAELADIADDVLGKGESVPQKCEGVNQPRSFRDCLEDYEAAQDANAPAKASGALRARTAFVAAAGLPSTPAADGEGGLCDAVPVPDGCPLPPDGCPPGQTDYNGDELGCGEPPSTECPAGETDYNGELEGCGEPPSTDCPAGETDYNGDLHGCGEPSPTDCPAGETDYNGDLPGCGEPSTAVCPPGQPDYNGQADGCGVPPSNNQGNPPSNGSQGPVTSAGGGIFGGNGAGSEGTVPGASTGSTVPGTTACGDPAICTTATVQGVDATTVTSSPAASGGAVLPDTGAPANSQGLLVVGFGLLAAGVLLVRPRRLARHRA